jgi:hypothetical protein
VPEKEKVFRGHISECLEHYRDTLKGRKKPGSKGVNTTRKAIAKFCGVKVTAIYLWFRNPERLPIGENYFKLLFFLDLVGYDVIELGRMKEAYRKFAELIAFGLLSRTEAVEIAGYAELSTLYHVLKGDRKASDRVDQKMWDAWKERRVELREQREEILSAPWMRERLSSKYKQVQTSVASSDSNAENLPTTFVEQLPQLSGKDARPKRALIILMEGLTALMDELSFDSSLGLSEKDSMMIVNLTLKLNNLSTRLMMNQQKSGDRDA